ncbi:hypothetical protein GGP41_001038, partial [Bipolaris sorokiniana]
LWSMIDFVQESGRAQEQGKAVVLAVAEEERRQRAQQRAQRVRQKQQADKADETETETEIETETETDESKEMDDSQAVARLIRTRGCRRRAISRYMDGTEASCRQLEEVATADQVVAWCDNCNRRRAGSTQEAIQQEAVVEATTTTADTSGQEAWQADAQLQAVQERVVRAKLNELAQQICPYCWGILHEIFGGERSARRIEEEQEAEHSIWECWRLIERDKRVQQPLDSVRRWIRYSKELDICWKCGMIQKLCEWESGEQQQQKCS